MLSYKFLTRVRRCVRASVQEPGINWHMSMACLKDNELRVLNSINFLFAWLFLLELYFFLNTDLITPAILHYKIFDMICFIFCIRFSSALTITVKYFLAWVEQRFPKGGPQILGTLLGFWTGNAHMKVDCREAWYPVWQNCLEAGRLGVGMFDSCEVLPPVGCEVLDKLFSFSASVSFSVY